jgi:hypothetical protein
MSEVFSHIFFFRTGHTLLHLRSTQREKLDLTT